MIKNIHSWTFEISYPNIGTKS